METEILMANHRPNACQRLLPAVAPVILIAVGYVDPGKWAAIVEGGAHFGLDLVPLMLIFNFTAILYQCLSAYIAIITGRNLSKICSEEYDKATCIFLGVQTELSIISLDLTMILGAAHALNLAFGMDLLTCVFLASFDAVLFPVLVVLLDNGKSKFLCICMTSFILLCYIFEVLINNQHEMLIPTSGTLTELGGESAFALMSLLGANIMPHNFYLHSSIVQQDPAVSKGALCHDHFFAILCIFSGIFLVNYVLMNLAANVFHNAGLVLLSFQDVVSLMDQVYKSPTALFAFLVFLLFSKQMIVLTQNFGREAVLHDLLGMDIPNWLHHATIRIMATVPALYCMWNSGAEGVYQLLLSTQVIVALLLPSSVIPLIRVASSRSIMGMHKVSQFLEFLALISFIGMFGVNIIFVVEMTFGNSDWVGNLRSSLGSGSISMSYIFLLIIASVSLCLMLWLAVTPLKSASSRLDAQLWSWDIQNAVPEISAERDDGGQCIQEQELTFAPDKSLDNHSDKPVTSTDLNLPETLYDSHNEPFLSAIEGSSSTNMFASTSVCHPEDSTTTIEPDLILTACDEISDVKVLCHPEDSTATIEPDLILTACDEISDVKVQDTCTMKTESTDLVEKTVRVEGDLQSENDDEGDAWETEESFEGVSLSIPSLTSEGPGSFRSLSGKSDDSGSGAGSPSRLAGLGRAARRQLAAVLDEFWGQLYDFHGQATQEAKAKKLDALLGIDLKVDTEAVTMQKVNTSRKGFTGYLPSVSGGGSDSVINSSFYVSPKQQQRLQHRFESSYGVQGGSTSLWSKQMPMLDAYVQKSSYSALDFGGRYNPSLGLPPSSYGYDHQPATIHGYKIASLFSKIAKEKPSDYLNDQMEALNPKCLSLGTSNYRDSFGFAMGQKLQNGLAPANAPGFQNHVVSRNNLWDSEKPVYNLSSAGPVESMVSTVNAKKFHSLPDISGLLHQQSSQLSDWSSERDNSTGCWPSVGHAIYDRSLYSSTVLRAYAPFAFDQFSPSKVRRDTFPLQLSSGSLSSGSDTGSLWSRQPFEQFGVADGAVGVGSNQNSINQEATYAVDLEARLLQSFRHCIGKLLKLEGSDWLFRQDDGADEDLIDCVAARERYLYEAETREMSLVSHAAESPYSSDRKPPPGFKLRKHDADCTKYLASSIPHCREGCIWGLDLITSFGVWCIHRVLDLSLLESRPELWGKYTYILNRLQGIIDLAFSRPRFPMTHCLCLQTPVAHQQRLSPPIKNGGFTPPVKEGRGEFTTAAKLLDIIKDVEIAISRGKGRTGTAAGEAFQKGKDNLTSVLKRYKRRLSNKPAFGSQEVGSMPPRVPTSAPLGL